MSNQIKQTGLQEVVNQQAEPAEPSASCVPPIPPREQQGPPEQSLLEDRRPEVPWVAAVAERLEKPISQHRQKYAPGQKSWAAASQQYACFDGPAQPSTTPSNINEIALDTQMAAAAAELSAARTALGITDPAFECQRNTMVIEGRPTQVAPS